MRYEKVIDITVIVIVIEFELFYDIVHKWWLSPRSSSWYVLFLVSYPVNSTYYYCTDWHIERHDILCS